MPHHNGILGRLELMLPTPALRSQVTTLLLCKIVLAIRAVADSDRVANTYQRKTELIRLKNGSFNHWH